LGGEFGAGGLDVAVPVDTAFNAKIQNKTTCARKTFLIDIFNLLLLIGSLN
jgi:hypothetical protein